MDLKIEDDNGKVFIDDLNKICLANPDLFESSNSLKEESDNFIGQLEDFSSLVHSVRSTLEQVGQINDSERLRAMTAQNELKKIAEGGIAQQENQQLQILIKERQMELERLKVELQSYKSIEAQQSECLQQLRSSQ